MATSAFGIPAPDGSVIRPERVAPDTWAAAGAANKRFKQSAMAMLVVRPTRPGNCLGKFVQRKEFEAASEAVAAGKGDLTDPKQKATEAEAIEQAKQGNEAAFEVLYHLAKRRVYSLCLRMVSNPAQAEDLAQEAFLQLFRKIGTFRGESA